MAYSTAISTAATAHVSLVESSGTATFTATGSGAQVQVADILTELQKSTITNVVINNGSSGSESGAVTWDSGADLDFTGISGSKTLKIAADSSSTAGSFTVSSNVVDSAPGSETLAVELDAIDGVTLNGSLNTNGAGVTLAASSGSISQAGTGTIAASLLTASSTTGIALEGPNRVSSFSATNSSSGDVQFINTQDLYIDGVSQSGSGDVDIENFGAIDSASGQITTSGSGQITVNSNQSQGASNGYISISGLTVNSRRISTSDSLGLDFWISSPGASGTTALFVYWGDGSDDFGFYEPEDTNEVAISHSYSAPGRYQVKIFFSDPFRYPAGDSVSVTFPITVTPPPPKHPPGCG